MIAKIPSIKRAAKTRILKQPDSGVNLGYIALHSTNLALCLAGGMLAVRHEPSAAVDHHAAAGGKLVVSRGPAPSDILIAAKGANEYGEVVLVELNLVEHTLLPTMHAGVWHIEVPVPLALIRRIIFRTTADQLDFFARTEGYGDVPEGVVDAAADPELFDGGPGQVTISVAQNIDAASVVHAQMADKLAGAFATAVFTVRTAQPSGLFTEALLRAFEATSSAESADVFVATLASEIDVEGVNNRRLIAVASSLLASLDPHAGIDPEAFLDSLNNLELWGNGTVDSVTERFILHAGDVVSLRRELAEDAFEDAPGKIIPRALLLFLLNADADRFWMVPKRVKKLGPRVHLLAAVLVGCFTGITNLPATVKAPTRSVFLGLGILLSRIWKNGSCTFQRSTHWDAEGNRHEVTALDGFELLAVVTQPHNSMVRAYEAAVNLRLAPMYDCLTGGLLLTIECRDGICMVSALQSLTPTMPRQDAVEFRLLVSFVFANKELMKIVGEINKVAKDTGIFASVDGSRKVKQLQLSILCPAHLVTVDVLDASVRMLVEQVKLLSPKPPVQHAV